MWILPKNYQLSSLYAPDMVESKEDLTLPGLNIESALMWRSKPSPLRTWLPRWKRVSWMPHLCGRILKPCQWSHFETELTSSLAVIPANLFQPQESDLEKKTPDTSGLTSATSSGQLDLFGASLKTSKDTSVSDSEKSLATWKALVIQRRGEYSLRVKSAHRIRESESTSWRTPAVSDPGITLDRLQTKDGSSPRSGERLYDKETGRNAQYGLTQQVQMEPTQWLTPRVMEVDESYDNYQRRMKASGNPKNIGKTRPANLTMQVKMEPTQWPTPSARDYKGANGLDATLAKIAKGERAHMGQLPNVVMVAEHLNLWPTPTVQDSDKATKKMRENHQNNLTAVVFDQESFPTPTASEAEHYRMGGNSQMSQSLSAKARKGELLPTPTTRDWKGGYKEEALTRKDGKSRRFDALPNAAIGGVGTDIVSGHLNPEFVEWLMGVPTGWTALDFWETE